MMSTLTCDHCLLAFPEGGAIREEGKVFCCNGCRGIYRIIHAEGLDAFYQKRRWDEAGIPASVLKAEIDTAPFEEYVRDRADGDKEIDIHVEGIRCASCVWLNERILSRMEGVRHARFNYATHRARIVWDPERAGLGELLKRILSIGYRPKPYRESDQFRIRKAETRDLLIRFGTAAFLSSQLMIYSIALYAGYFQGIDSQTKRALEIIAMALTTPVLFYSGMSFLRNTLTGLRHFHFTMDSLITIGAGSAYVYSIAEIISGGEVYFDTSAMIITLILLGRYIEASAKGRASEALERLTELIPKTATRLVPADAPGPPGQEVVDVASIRRGDLVRVKPGERIPLDGVVTEGKSETDESLLTGEAKPVLKAPGSDVIGGSINLYGILTFTVTRAGKETVLSHIIQAVEDAQAGRPRIQTLADRVVGWFVPFILLAAFATLLSHLSHGASLHHALMTGISVLVIACPCSLGLATPLAVLMFTGLASSKGILIRSGEVIEKANGLTGLVLDKTGTVTVGRPVLRETVVMDCDLDRTSLLGIAASLERLSEHSIGQAIAAASSAVFSVSEFRAFPGKGVEGIIEGKRILIGNRSLMEEHGLAMPPGSSYEEEMRRSEKGGDTVVFLGWEGRVRAFLVVSDVVREEAREAVEEIRKMNYALSLVSGDNAATTGSIASRIGIGHFIAEASPVRKREIIGEMQVRGGRVMMVGDGVNDAPALTEAIVGLAMGRGTDIAKESADAVLVRSDLRLIPYFIRLSRQTFRIIKENIFWAFFYNVVAIPLAMTGVLHPIVAAGAMAASSLFVVGNSLRIRRCGR
jgi:Cu2+-exporting ATPase